MFGHALQAWLRRTVDAIRIRKSFGEVRFDEFDKLFLVKLVLFSLSYCDPAAFLTVLMRCASVRRF